MGPEILDVVAVFGYAAAAVCAAKAIHRHIRKGLKVHFQISEETREREAKSDAMMNKLGIRVEGSSPR